eukprot:TRINITY_DN4945_c0_g1_i4.p1 TRINITY_DN4945_c0_g1~~TRINITY_DN4945_c0_g1_i4.p1  ORF type:complete len:290 (-),score=48.95 TRINITY_DN4945_c0_g1_i4:236-1105(-)
MGSASQVTIVMGDSRTLLPEDIIPATPADASWNVLTSALNLQYAKQHGYNFMFLQYTGDCILDQHGSKVKRHPAWCKILALQHAAQAHKGSVVVWIDTDAIFAKQTITVQRFLEDSMLYIPGVNPLVNSSLPVNLSKEDCGVYMLKDKYAEYNRFDASEDWANSGVMIWPQPFNHSLLSEWWRVNKTADVHFWEQSAFNDVIIPRHPRESCVIDNANSCRQSAEDFIWHHNRCYKKAGMNIRAAIPKEPFFHTIFPEISHSDFRELVGELRDHIVEITQDRLDVLAGSL